jgi:hypothetical protein
MIVIGALYCYRKGINRLLTGSKITLKIGGLSVETTAPDLEKSVFGSLGGHLSPKQKELLKNLRDQVSLSYSESEIGDAARPLRDAGLIKYFPPNKQLINAKTIELTVLGKLVADAAS